MSVQDDIPGDPNLIVTGGLASIGNYAVIGHPVAHSRSPELHEAWFSDLRHPGVYRAEDIPPTELIHLAPSLPYEFAGLNVTIPHKVSVLGFVDRVDPAAEAAGATNILYRDEDKAWTAGNTDGEGFLRALNQSTGETVQGKDAVILGAGGSARAIGSALVQAGAASVIFVNRTLARAEEVNSAVGGSGAAALHPEVLDSFSVSVDLLISTLPPEADAAVGSLELTPLGSEAIVADINYYVDQPPLLRRANSAGLRVVDGRGMFLWQAALSCQLWTGHMPNLELGRRLLGMACP